MEKPFGTDLAVGARAERDAPQRLRRVADLPDRPLPRQGGGAEHPRAAVRERHVRAGLEPRPHRPRPDRRSGDALDRHAGELLRAHRRLPRHGRDAPVPGARLRRDGAADLARAEDAASPRRRRCSTRCRRCDPADVVRGQYEGYRDEHGVAPDSDTETFVAVRAQVDNWRWAACRSSCGRASAWPRAATCSRSPSASRRGACSRSTADFAAESFGSDHLTFELGDPGSISVNFLAKVPGPDDAARRGRDGLQLRRRLRRARAGARGLRAADPRRDDRRPHAVHDARTESSGCGRSRRPCSRTRRRCSPTRPAPGGPRPSTS